MLQWIAMHIGGWQVLVPAVVVFCLAGRRLDRYLPLTFGVVWLLSIVAMYVMAGIGRFVTISHLRWAAMVGMAALGVAIPIGVAYIASAAFRRAEAGLRWGAAFVAGLLAVPLTSVVAGIVGDIVLPMLRQHQA